MKKTIMKAYQPEMDKLTNVLEQPKAALTDGRNSDALAIVDQINVVMRQAHASFRK